MALSEVTFHVFYGVKKVCSQTVLTLHLEDLPGLQRTVKANSTNLFMVFMCYVFTEFVVNERILKDSHTLVSRSYRQLHSSLGSDVKPDS